MVTSTHLFNIIFRVIDKASEQLNRMQSASSRAVNNIIRQSTLLPQVIRSGVTEISTMIGKIDQSIAKTSIFNKKMLGLGLGMTFFMWGVQMQLHRMLRSMFNIFQQAEGDTGALNQQFNIVRANLAAISIAFFDAFAQSGLFDSILSFVTTLADWYLNLTDSQREWITSGTVGLFGIILGIQFLGQLILAVNTVLALPMWGLWSIAALLSVLAVIKVVQFTKEVIKDLHKHIEQHGKIAWANWRLAGLDNIYITLQAASSWLGKVFGQPWMTGALQDILEAKRQANIAVNNAMTGVSQYPDYVLGVGGYIKERGGYVDSRGNFYPTPDPNFVPNQGNKPNEHIFELMLDELKSMNNKQSGNQKVEVVNTDIFYQKFNSPQG